MMRKNGAAMAALAEAFPLTLPIFAGFWFIAFAYGFYMNTLGFSWVYPMVSVKFSSVIHLTVDNYYLRDFGFISISV